MKPVHFLPAVVLGWSLELATDYESERSLRIETLVTLEMQTVDFSMERNGEPVEAGFGSDATSEETRRAVVIDRFLASEDGRPTKVRRTFDTLEGRGSIDFGGNTRESESACPLDGVVLELSLVADEVEVEIVDGEADEELLRGHRLSLAIDALLPEGEVTEGKSWDLESEAIARALGLDVAPLYFRPSGGDEGDEGERGGRRGGRFGGGGSTLASFGEIEWAGRATLTAASVDRDGLACAEIALEFEGSADLPEPEGGFGRGGGRAPARAGAVPSASPSALARFENTISVELEGTLFFAIEAKRPLALHLRGTVETERDVERTNGDFSMKMYTAREGKIEYEVTLTEAE